MPARSDRIVVDPAVLGGKPVVRGTRIPVHLILGMLGSGMSREDVLREYPSLNALDLDAAVLYAARVMEGTDLEAGVV